MLRLVSIAVLLPAWLTSMAADHGWRITPNVAPAATVPAAPDTQASPADVAPMDDAAPPATTTAEERTAEKIRELTVRLGSRRPIDQFTASVFGRPLTIGGEWVLEPRYQDNFNLDEADDDDRLRLDQELQLEFTYPVNERLILFLEGKVLRRDDIYRDDDREESNTELQRGQSWVYLAPEAAGPFALQAGRQNINEPREWWWDEDLDAVRLHFRHRRVDFELSIGEEAGTLTLGEDLDPEQKDVRRLLGRAGWTWLERQRLELYLLYQDDRSDLPIEGTVVPKTDRDESDADLIWVGLRATGRWKLDNGGRIYYWLDSAMVRGDELLVDYDSISDTESIVDDIDELQVRGWGLDAGATWSPPDTRLSFTLAFAHGSGDDDRRDDTDHAFRQTGLQNNDGKFRGVNRFRYYGEVLRPELSNLRLLTLSAGWRFWNRSSVELLYHRYWQDKPAPFLRDTSLNSDPAGDDDALGDELDLVVGIEEWTHWDLEFIAAMFRAGRAFGEAEDEVAWGLFGKVKFYF